MEVLNTSTATSSSQLEGPSKSLPLYIDMTNLLFFYTQETAVRRLSDEMSRNESKLVRGGKRRRLTADTGHLAD